MSKQQGAAVLPVQPCDGCVFQSIIDGDSFRCVKRAPVARNDGVGQWPRLVRSHFPPNDLEKGIVALGCGEGKPRLNA